MTIQKIQILPGDVPQRFLRKCEAPAEGCKHDVAVPQSPILPIVCVRDLHAQMAESINQAYISESAIVLLRACNVPVPIISSSKTVAKLLVQGNVAHRPAGLTSRVWK